MYTKLLQLIRENEFTTRDFLLKNTSEPKKVLDKKLDQLEQDGLIRGLFHRTHRTSRYTFDIAEDICLTSKGLEVLRGQRQQTGNVHIGSVNVGGDISGQLQVGANLNQVKIENEAQFLEALESLIKDAPDAQKPGLLKKANELLKDLKENPLIRFALGKIFPPS